MSKGIVNLLVAITVFGLFGLYTKTDMICAYRDGYNRGTFETIGLIAEFHATPKCGTCDEPAWHCDGRCYEEIMNFFRPMDEWAKENSGWHYDNVIYQVDQCNKYCYPK